MSATATATPTTRSAPVVLASVVLSVLASTTVVAATGLLDDGARMVAPSAPVVAELQDDLAQELDQQDRRRTASFCPLGARPALAC